MLLVLAGFSFEPGNHSSLVSFCILSEIFCESLHGIMVVTGRFKSGFIRLKDPSLHYFAMNVLFVFDVCTTLTLKAILPGVCCKQILCLIAVPLLARNHLRTVIYSFLCRREWNLWYPRRKW